jgi:DNA primase
VNSGRFDRSCLPAATTYFTEREQLRLFGHGIWRSARCPFRDDLQPSLRVNVEVGAFRCMACGAKGGDVMAFHMQRHGVRFVAAAKGLGAWKGEQ